MNIPTDTDLDKIKQMVNDRKKIQSTALMEQKRRVWETMKANHPDMAEFMRSMHATFGEHAEVEIELPETGKMKIK